MSGMLTDELRAARRAKARFGRHRPVYEGGSQVRHRVPRRRAAPGPGDRGRSDILRRSMPSPGNPEELKRWVENQRAAAERERQQALGGSFVRDPVRAGLDLIALAARLHGWPIPEDPVRQREDELARERWSRLRKALGAP